MSKLWVQTTFTSLGCLLLFTNLKFFVLVNFDYGSSVYQVSCYRFKLWVQTTFTSLHCLVVVYKLVMLTFRY